MGQDSMSQDNMGQERSHACPPVPLSASFSKPFVAQGLIATLEGSSALETSTRARGGGRARLGMRWRRTGPLQGGSEVVWCRQAGAHVATVG